MSAIRSTNNRTEATLRKTLHALGLRYRKYKKGLVGKPDIAFPREQIAIFVDGDYWHGRSFTEQGIKALKSHFTGEQRSYWLAKIRRNAERDREVTAALRADGWLVLRYWESDVKRNYDIVARKVFAAVQRRRARINAS